MLYIDMCGNNPNKRYHVVNTESKRRICIDPTQTWFWTDEWQEGEREVDRHYAAGNYKHFDNIDDMFSELST